MPGSGLGALYQGGRRCRFRVWAPNAEVVEVRILARSERVAGLERDARGYHEGAVEGVEPGSLYMYRLDGQERPDPASRLQPQGVHGPSAVVDPAFDWTDADWPGLRLQDYVFYELHVGTYTPAGTFDAIIPHLDALRELGITALELMPVAQFPGSRNWGYDGVFLYAVQESYGGPAGLRRLVDACHARGLAVVLDVVYNHLGPEGNVLADFGPYFTGRYHTPWGDALNFDGPASDDVRRFFIENALHWVTEHHIDAFRLDAVHAIVDPSARPFLEELAAAVHECPERLGRRVHLIAETDLNDPRFVRPTELGGYGVDAQWNDDFHHALHALLTGERTGYYRDFGQLRQLADAFAEGYAYTGQFSAYRRRRHGRPPEGVPASRFVVCAQNHDQVGNRARGDRLSRLVPFEAQKLAAGAVLLSPFLPLLFMGEEYGETAPFPYFTSHSDPALVEAVRRGRREEFEAFAWQGELPDPQEEATFRSAVLRHEPTVEDEHRVLREFHRELLRLRRTVPALAASSLDRIDVVRFERECALVVRRWVEDEWAADSAAERGSGRGAAGSEAAMLLHFADALVRVPAPLPAGTWREHLNSAEERWGGPGRSAVKIVESEGVMDVEVGAWGFAVWVREG